MCVNLRRIFTRNALVCTTGVEQPSQTFTFFICTNPMKRGLVAATGQSYLSSSSRCGTATFSRDIRYKRRRSRKISLSFVNAAAIRANHCKILPTGPLMG